MKLINLFRETYKIIIPVIGILIGAIILIVSVGAIVSNEQNRIFEGTVIEKDYSSGYTRYEGSEGNTKLVSVPAQYYLCLRGMKNGEVVQYWCEVTEYEYNSVKVGDYFKR